MANYCTLYATFPDLEAARTVAKALLGNKLVACCNILPHVESHYMWEESLHCDKEVVLFAKTQTAKQTEITSQIEAMHSYDCPCILFYPIESGSAEYLDWIKDSLT